MTKRWIALLLCMAMMFTFVTVAQAANKTEVVFWNGFTGPDQPVLKQIVDDFNTSQDQIQIKMEIMPWDTLYQKLMPAMIAGNAPDLIAIDSSRYSEYAMAGKLEALDSYIEKSAVITNENLVQGLFNAGKYDGKQYAIPMACAAMVMYYNKALFRDAGLDPENPPKTMDELQAAWTKLIKKDVSGNVTQYAQSIGVKATVPMIPVFMWANGAEYIVDGKSALASPEAVEAMTVLADSFANGISPVGLTGQEADNLFAAQKAAIEFNGPWAIPGFRGAGIDLGIAEVPSGKGGHKTWGGGTILCISADSKVKDAAWTFIEYFNNTQAQTKWSLGVGFIPTRLDMSDNKELLAGNPDISIFMKAAMYADIFMADQPLSGRIEGEILVPLYEAVTRGTATPADALKKASDQLDALLAE